MPIRRFVPVALALLFLGCSEQLVDELERFGDRACECEDRACAETVQRDFLAWYEKNKRARGTDSNRKRAEAAATRFETCVRALGVGPSAGAAGGAGATLPTGDEGGGAVIPPTGAADPAAE